MTRKYELWSDSFHEGDWMCSNISKQISSMGGSTEISYKYNFIPIYKYTYKDLKFEIIVYGNYNNWTPVPERIEELLHFGKPDGILYDKDNSDILFVIEETAAVPSGNQGVQRSERLYGSSKYKYPFWYLLSEFGMHKDGGVRRDSIWPTIQSLKLSMVNKTPSFVLHYSDMSDPENYDLGEGMEFLFKSVTQMLLNNVLKREDIFYNMDFLVKQQYQNMINFLDSQWNNILTYLPGEEYLSDEHLAEEITDYVLDRTDNIPEPFNKGFLMWPTLDNIPTEELNQLSSNGLIKYDTLANLLEKAVDKKEAYTLSSNASSGRPSTEKQLSSYIAKQKNSFDSSNINPPVSFNMDISQFPQTNTGRYHVTTSKNIVYLLDSWSYLKQLIFEAYPRLNGLLDKYDKFNETPSMFYISNSVCKGRIYGDPYTGQICAYTLSLGHNITSKRFIVTYYPHQVHNLYIPNRRNKGKTILKDIVNISIYHGGIVVDNDTKEMF